MARDPVWGMMVDEKTAKHVSEYQHKKYFFCSAACKETFEKDPKRYVYLA